MAALARVIKEPMRIILKKKVYGIRHGEAWHNALHPVMGEKAFTDHQDTSLTTTGMVQAVQNRGLPVELVLVSPLMRALQTAELMFPMTPKVALECLKEYPQAGELCNKRSARTSLQFLFPHISFTNLKTEEDETFGTVDPDMLVELQCDEIRRRLRLRPEHRIALVTHSSWLKIYMGSDVGGVGDELEHCKPYELKL